jgi:hypothetical protein
MAIWWKHIKGPTRRRVVLIQIDVGGHSDWLAAEYARSYIEPWRSRRKLAKLLADSIVHYGYAPLFWAGDGGIFGSKLSPSGHPQNVCQAADAIFSVFSRWKEKKPVELRVSATSLELTIDRDPGSWCGRDLNEFLKYERHISLPNAFVITDQLRAALAQKGAISRFSKPRQVPLPNGHIITCYTDKRHPYAVARSAQSFGVWLRGRTFSDLGISQREENNLISVGKCTVLDTALRESGYGEIVLTPRTPIDVEGVLLLEDRALWQKERQNLSAKKVSGTSMQVTHFTPELSDDPHPRLDYCTVSYTDSHAFHLLHQANPTVAQKYRRRAIELLARGTDIPNILSSAIIAIIGSDGETPQLLIANRKGREGGYHGSSWAVSIGEQFMPVTGLRGSRLVPADNSITTSITRGLQEELLGDTFTGPMRISVHALCVENYLNNFIFVAIADLRPLSFSDLVSLWRGAVDRAEHDAIASMPLTSSILRRCLLADSLPTDVWASMHDQQCVEFGPGIADLNSSAHNWQPNSHVRLAAWWYVQRRPKNNKPNDRLKPR